MDFRKAAVLAFLLRLILIILPLSKICEQRVELSTVVDSYESLKEGIFLWKQGLNPYEGDVVLQAPLMLLQPTGPLLSGKILHSVLICLADIIAAYGLSLIGPNSSAYLFYLFNPIQILSTVASSSVVWHNAFIISAIAMAKTGKDVISAISLATAVYLDMYPIIILPPTALLFHISSNKSRALYVTVFILSLLSLVGLSYWLVGQRDYLENVYGTRFFFRNLTPNIGLWWYFMIEMFDELRLTFILTFQIHIVLYVAPLCIRLHSYPLFTATTLIGVLSIFKSYPVAADASMFWSLILAQPHVMSQMRSQVIPATVILFGIILGPVFYYIWIVLGSGNANFFYAITLVWAIGQGVVLASYLFACLKYTTLMERPSLKGRKIVQ